MNITIHQRFIAHNNTDDLFLTRSLTMDLPYLCFNFPTTLRISNSSIGDIKIPPRSSQFKTNIYIDMPGGVQTCDYIWDMNHKDLLGKLKTLDIEVPDNTSFLSMIALLREQESAWDYKVENRYLDIWNHLIQTKI